MNKEEYELIKNIIRRDVKNGDTEDLIKLRKYINGILAVSSKQRTTIDDRVLSEKLEDFISRNTDCTPRALQNIHNLINSISTSKNMDANSILVGDVVGMGTETLTRENGVSSWMLSYLEQTLNAYGLSMNAKKH